MLSFYKIKFNRGYNNFNINNLNFIFMEHYFSINDDSALLTGEEIWDFLQELHLIPTSKEKMVYLNHNIFDENDEPVQPANNEVALYTTFNGCITEFTNLLFTCKIKFLYSMNKDNIRIINNNVIRLTNDIIINNEVVVSAGEFICFQDIITSPINILCIRHKNKFYHFDEEIIENIKGVEMSMFELNYFNNKANSSKTAFTRILNNIFVIGENYILTEQLLAIKNNYAYNDIDKGKETFEKGIEILLTGIKIVDEINVLGYFHIINENSISKDEYICNLRYVNTLYTVNYMESSFE